MALYSTPVIWTGGRPPIRYIGCCASPGRYERRGTRPTSPTAKVIDADIAPRLFAVTVDDGTHGQRHRDRRTIARQPPLHDTRSSNSHAPQITPLYQPLNLHVKPTLPSERPSRKHPNTAIDPISIDKSPVSGFSTPPIQYLPRIPTHPCRRARPRDTTTVPNSRYSAPTPETRPFPPSTDRHDPPRNPATSSRSRLPITPRHHHVPNSAHPTFRPKITRLSASTPTPTPAKHPVVYHPHAPTGPTNGRPTQHVIQAAAALCTSSSRDSRYLLVGVAKLVWTPNTPEFAS